MPVLGENGEIREWVGTCVDVDDYKRVEAARKVADQRKDEFLAVLAHEFRNLLAPVRMAADILRARDAGNAQQNSLGTRIGRQVDQIARLLEDLLDVNRITRQQMVLQKARVTVDSIVKASLETSRPLLEQHGHHFELKDLAGPLWVEADPMRLAQVFTNLLNNAAKYSDRGGKVSLTIRSEGDHVSVAVKDSGIGIEPDMLPRLFKMFSRTTSAIQRSRDGLGIGLALARGHVEAHGGTVQAYSQGVGHGSEFVVRVPLAH